MNNSKSDIDDLLDKMHCCGQIGTLNMEDDKDRAEAKAQILSWHNAEVKKIRAKDERWINQKYIERDKVLEVLKEEPKPEKTVTGVYGGRKEYAPGANAAFTKCRNDLRQEIKATLKLEDK